MDQEYLTIEQLANYLNFKRSTLYLKVSSGEIPFYRIGHLIRFKKIEIEGWIEGKKGNPPELKRTLKVKKTDQDIDKIVRRAIDQEKTKGYNIPQGNQTESRASERSV
jgi:excisionase family DNA binding protein